MAKLYHFGSTCNSSTCNSCKANVETRFHCTVCDDLDLCIKCHSTLGHVHKMQRLGFELGDDSAGGDQKQINPQESRRLAIQRCIASLEHACQCRDANCRLPSCQKMKRIVSHAKMCKRKGNGSCTICKQLIALNCYHAKNCQETKCPVPFCLNIKYKLKQQRMAQAQILKRRIATMQNLNMTAKQPGQPMELRSQSQIIGANNMPNTAGSAPGAVRIPQGMSNPGTSSSSAMQLSSNAQVLQQLLTSLKSSNFAQQKQQVLYLLKSNPQLMAAFIKLRQGQQQAMIGQPLPQPRVWQQQQQHQQQQLLAMQQRQQMQPNQFPQPPMYTQRPQRMPMQANYGHQQGFQNDNFHFLQQRLQLLMSNQDMSNLGTSASSAMQQSSNSLLVLQQLLTSFKSSQSLSLKQQVLHLLKSNPQLMAVFIKERSAKASSTTTVETRNNEQARNDRAAASTAMGLATTTTASFAQQMQPN